MLMDCYPPLTAFLVSSKSHIEYIYKVGLLIRYIYVHVYIYIVILYDCITVHLFSSNGFIVIHYMYNYRSVLEYQYD